MSLLRVSPENASDLIVWSAWISDRYLQEVSELKAARAGASEVPGLRAQLVTAQDVSAGLVKARWEATWSQVP